MKSLDLFQQVLTECGDWCGTSTSQDFNTVLGRIETEGFSFLTITLPKFGKDFERSLDRGFATEADFMGYARQSGSKIPRFLSGFLTQIFDAASGVLVDQPSIAAIRAIRQITLMFAKIDLPCTPDRVHGALLDYVDCDAEVGALAFKRQVMEFMGLPRSSGDSVFQIFDKSVVALYSQAFSNLDKLAYHGDFVPAHGPGATAERIKGNQKYNQLEWTSRLESMFPYREYLSSSYSLSTDIAVNFREPGTERPVRVITVPKTQSKPRIIAIEPTCMQYVQQGILHAIETELEKPNNTSLSKFIGWKSQIPNQEMARESSKDGTLATLDLSEASDRVDYEFVRRMFKNHPHLWAAIDACRSTRAHVSGDNIDGVIRLSKFASMGSALCFPVEAMVFMAIILTAVAQQLNIPPMKALRKLRSPSRVRVYGDDIIVPVDYVSSVIDALSFFGLKVNNAKSFWTGKFRESCGKEYYDGHDVSIIRVRAELPTNRKHDNYAAQIVSTVSTRNQLWKAGYFETVSHLDDWIERFIPFPIVEEGCGALGRWSFDPPKAEFWDKDLHKPLVKAAVVSYRLPTSELEGYGALMKFFLKKGEKPIYSKEHLLRAGRPGSVTLKIRRTSPYSSAMRG